MMRGYFSLAIPVCITAIAAITWMQIRHANPALARAGEIQLAQAQPGVDPFAPQPEPAPPSAVQPNAAEPGAAQPNAAQPNAAQPAPVRPNVHRNRTPRPKPHPARPIPALPYCPPERDQKVPENDDEVKTPILRSLLASLEEMQEGTDEEKDGLRKMMYEADVELRHSLGDNTRNSIRAANNPKFKAFEVKPPQRRFPPRMRPKPEPVPQPEVQPPAVPAPAENVDPAPAPPADPAPNAVDDLFKDPAADNANQ